MIRVTLHSRGGSLNGFECVGHADYAEAGRDIVCAEVSSRSGSMLLALPAGSGHDAQVILKTLRQGLRDLAQAYPKYLLLKEN